MDFIHKFIPKNPINDATLERIKDRVKTAVEVFAKNYAKKTYLVIVATKEDEYEEKEKRKSIVKKDKENKIKYFKKQYGEEADVPNFPEIPEKDCPLEDMESYCRKMLDLGFKPLFPRGKLEPLGPPELKVEITRYVIRDSEYDPYAAYVIKSTKGSKVAEKERRFREFERLNKSLKKLITKDCVLPSASSKIGVRNLTPEFLDSRVKDLDAYLQNVIKIPGIQDNEDFQKFIGFFPVDPLDEKIFEATFRKTKWDLWVWGDIKYDEPRDAISKLITLNVWKDVSSDIYHALPAVEAPRRASLKLAYKVISGIIDAAVPPAWDVAYAASKKVRGTVQGVLDSVIGPIIEKKNDLNNQLKEKMMDAFTPIKEALGKLFAEAVHKAVPPIVEPFAVVYKTYAEVSEPLIMEALRDCNKDKMKEGTDAMNKIHEDLVAKLNEKVDEQLKNICEELNGLVSLQLLRDCFNPMKAIGRIIADFVRIINPEHWGVVATKMFEYKKRLSDCNKEGVDKILHEMERYVYWEMDWRAFLMDNGRYSLRYHIYALGLGLDAIADICFDLGRKLIKQVFKRSCKKFYRKFSDYVWGFSMKKDDDKPWAERVDEAMTLAYQAAKHKFNKECGNIIKRCVCDILGGVIVNKVIEQIVEKIGDLIKKLADVIPENIKEMIDVEEMAKNDIQEVLTATFEGAVYDQNESFVEELNKAIDNCKI